MPEPAGRTALYRYLDAAGRPLYIGITGNLKERGNSHRYSTWDREATSFTYEWHETVDAALAAEYRAIKAEKPAYNREHNFGDILLSEVAWPSLATDRRTKAILLAEFMQSEIDSGHWPVDYRIPGPRELAAQVDIGAGTAVSAMKKLVARRYAYARGGLGHFVRLPPPRPTSGRSPRSRLAVFQ